LASVSRPLSLLLFLVVAFAVLGTMHFYLWVRLVRDTALGEPWRRIITVFMILAVVGIPAAVFLVRLAGRSLTRVIPVAVFSWLGAALILVSAVLAGDLLRWLGLLASRIASVWSHSSNLPVDPDRRLFLARAFAGSTLLVGGAASTFAVHRALEPPEVSEVPVKLDRLPPALSGFTIAQLSDLHVGPATQRQTVERAVETTNALRPDLVVITGDLVDAGVPELRETVAALQRLRARHGVHFVTGNHEYYAGVGPWLAELRRLGIQVLHNQRVPIGDPGPGGASFDLAGVDDWSVGRVRDDRWTNLDQALTARDPDRSLVLLAHQPRGLDQAVQAGVELQLSGHTHGGQIFPFSLVVAAVYPYVKGLHRHQVGADHGQVFISRGTGYWGPPMRLGNPPEIARIVLL
jgi:uncharacterized protein